MKAVLLALSLFLLGVQNTVISAEDGHLGVATGYCATEKDTHVIYQILYVPQEELEKERAEYMVVIWGLYRDRNLVPFVVTEFRYEGGNWKGHWYVDLDLDGYADLDTEDFEELVRRAGDNVCDTLRLMEAKGVL